MNMVLWFRNDLRITDNPALIYALDNGVNSAIFFVTPLQWHQHSVSAIQQDFILRHVQLLKQQLAQLGIELTIVEVADFTAQADYIHEHFANQPVIINRELELNEITRDAKLKARGIEFIEFESDVIVPKGLVLNKSGEMFKVFTPFKKAWLTYVRNHGFDCLHRPRLNEASTPNLRSDDKDTEVVTAQGDNAHTASIKWPLIDEVEQQVIPAFLQTKIDHYQEHRDIPGIKGTSGLSPYFAIGALSPRYMLALLLNRYPDLLSEQPAQAFCWLNEIIWREFYRHLLFHFPDLIKGRDFNDKYSALVWPNNPAFISAWQQGKTGYPIVDAAMRQLNTTGWMHNRLRMIVASFLTKHLLVDWRIGEQYFTEKLIDWDFAANNGGWQWSAGTGCDAQPYFRVFNPITQSEKFDPKGSFIRNYLPELADIPDKYIHFPHEYLAATNNKSYWPAIVEHKAAREKALAFYKAYL